MYYELYVDSLFLIDFVMNLYLLILTDRSFLRSATRRKLILGAAAGAVMDLAPFWWDAPVWVKYPLCMATGLGLMVWIAFGPKDVRTVCKIVGRLLLYSFLMGGFLLFIKDCFPFMQAHFLNICGVLLGGAIAFLLLTYVQERYQGQKKHSLCKATLIRGEARVSVTALIDSGNSLVEPISGKPVSVIDAEIFRRLWREGQEPYRAIPYRSIGKKRGILQGFLLPCLELELDGMTKVIRDVYVAVSEEPAGESSMILNPDLIIRAIKSKK